MQHRTVQSVLVTFDKSTVRFAAAIESLSDEFVFFDVQLRRAGRDKPYGRAAGGDGRPTAEKS
ncbi:MAG: hypothetical protein U0892_23190 [Pirellulales bacterium]